MQRVVRRRLADRSRSRCCSGRRPSASCVDTSGEEIEIGEDPKVLIERLTGLDEARAAVVYGYLRGKEIQTHGADHVSAIG